jgi:hypothetical protein
MKAERVQPRFIREAINSYHQQTNKRNEKRIASQLYLVAHALLFDRCLILRVVSMSVRELFVWRSQAGVGQKTLGLDGAIPLRKFVLKFLESLFDCFPCAKIV